MRHFKSISQFHESRNLPKPVHPLISVIDIGMITQLDQAELTNLKLDFYVISVKRMKNVKVKYGQNSFDFNEGIMSFISPNQIFSITPDKINEEVIKSGWVITIHPDFIWNTSLAKTIKQYEYWGYSMHEALFLSEKEEEIIIDIIQNIQKRISIQFG